MLVEKKVIAKLNKCYAILPLRYKNRNCFAVAAEKTDPCYLFDNDGNQIGTIWEKPGGVMSMVQVNGTDGQFIATHQFYSPDHSKEAKLVLVTPRSDQWEVKTLVTLPHVHRIDILERNGILYFLACCVKSGSDYEGDWSKPGKIYMAELPSNLSVYNEDENKPLRLTVLANDLPKNHGYYHIVEDGENTALISSNKGVFQLFPPHTAGSEWTIRSYIDEPTSDAVLTDLDGDGIKELATISPFHGDTISIYKLIEGKYTRIYQYPYPLEFSHAIYGGPFCGKNRIIIGHREGNRDLLVFTYDQAGNTYKAEVMDHDCGPANIYHYVKDGKDILISANRETDEIAMYTVTE